MQDLFSSLDNQLSNYPIILISPYYGNNINHFNFFNRFLIFHGKYDNMSDYNKTILFYEKDKENRKIVTLEDDHIFLKYKSWYEVYNNIINFICN